MTWKVGLDQQLKDSINVPSYPLTWPTFHFLSPLHGLISPLPSLGSLVNHCNHSLACIFNLPFASSSYPLPFFWFRTSFSGIVFLTRLPVSILSSSPWFNLYVACMSANHHIISSPCLKSFSGSWLYTGQSPNPCTPARVGIVLQWKEQMLSPKESELCHCPWWGFEQVTKLLWSSACSS